MLMIGFALGAVFWELPWVGDALREKYPSLFLCHIKTDPEVYLRRDLIEKQKTLVRRFDKGTVRKLFGYSR